MNYIYNELYLARHGDRVEGHRDRKSKHSRRLSLHFPIPLDFKGGVSFLKMLKENANKTLAILVSTKNSLCHKTCNLVELLEHSF